MATLTEIFSFRNISKTFERVLGGIPDREPAVFKKAGLTEPVVGNETTFHTTYGERRLVPKTQYGAPSRATTMKKYGQQSIVLNSFATHIEVQQLLLLRLREVGSTLAQKEASEFVTKGVKDHATRYSNNRLASRVSMLAYGKFWYDAGGNLLASATGSTPGAAVETLDLLVPAANRTNLGGIIGTTWSDPAANIYGHILKMQQRQVGATGRRLRHCFHGVNLPGYIFANTSFKQYFNFNPQYYKAFTDNPGTIPDGFMEMSWHNMGECMFETEDETVTKLFPDDGATFTPEIDDSVYTRFEGSVLIPDGAVGQAYATVDEALQHAKVVQGMGGFSTMTLEPISVKMVMVDNFLDVWKNPKDLLIPTLIF